MARKVFISFLGTNNYLQTKYELNGEVSGVVRFVQQALIDFLCKDWTEHDSVMIFYTKKSHDLNWVDNGQERLNEGAEIEKKGLCSTLKDMHLPMQIEDYKIDEGFSEDEIWEIFTTVFDKLQDDDQIYFDVTHAFRSIPLFSVVLFNYARFMKNTKLVSIHYGAFEKLGPAFKVKELPVDERIAPIIDLTSLVSLQNTNVATSNFMDFGKVGTIGNQIKTKTDDLESGDYKSSKAISMLNEQLKKLDFYIETCCIPDIRKGAYIQKIHECFKTVIKAESLHHSEKELLKKIYGQMKSLGFKPESSECNIKAAINWALKYNMLQQVYTLGQEFLITKFTDFISRNEKWMKQYAQGEKIDKKILRDYAGGILGAPPDKYQYDFAKNDRQIKELSDNNKEALKKQRQDLAEHLLSLDWIKSFKENYDVLRKNRNSLNHGNGVSKTMDELKTEFEDNFNVCMRIIENAEDGYADKLD